MSDDSREKVAAIFRELVGERVSRLDGSHYNHDSAAALAAAGVLSEKPAEDIYGKI